MNQADEVLIVKIRTYVEGLKDDDGVINIDNEAEDLLASVLPLLEDLHDRAIKLQDVKNLVAGMWGDESIYAWQIQDIFK